MCSVKVSVDHFVNLKRCDPQTAKMYFILLALMSNSFIYGDSYWGVRHKIKQNFVGLYRVQNEQVFKKK